MTTATKQASQKKEYKPKDWEFNFGSFDKGLALGAAKMIKTWSPKTKRGMLVLETAGGNLIRIMPSFSGKTLHVSAPAKGVLKDYGTEVEFTEIA